MPIDEMNPNFKYQMPGHELSEVKHEKDLGVIISNTLKMSDQCTAASNKTNMILELISRNIYYKSPELIKRLCSAFVRSHLDHDQDLPGKIQRRATKKISAFRNLPYDERLKRLDMFY